MKLYEFVDIAFEQKSFSNNFIPCIQPFKCLGNSGIKGIQYYNITFTKSLSLMVTNEKFHFKDYFVFANNEKEIDFLDEKKFKVISNEFSHNSLVYYFDEPFYYFLYSFYDNNRYIEFSKIQISEIETKLDLLIKNMIIDDEMITNKIEAYWILKKLGNIQIDYFDNIKNFDIIDQNFYKENQLEDENKNVSDLLASNIRFIEYYN
jgi:hypothetical protein